MYCLICLAGTIYRPKSFVISLQPIFQADNETTRVVTTHEAKHFSDFHFMNFLEASAKTGINIKEAFQLIAREIYQMLDEGRESVNVNFTRSPTSGRGCCKWNKFDFLFTNFIQFFLLFRLVRNHYPRWDKWWFEYVTHNKRVNVWTFALLYVKCSFTYDCMYGHWTFYKYIGPFCSMFQILLKYLM